MFYRNIKIFFDRICAAPNLLFVLLMMSGIPGWSAEPLMINLSAGSSHTLAVASDGKVYGWGSNEFGQLGDGTSYRRLAPVAVATTTFTGAGDPTKAIQVVAGDAHSVALGKDGKVVAWGVNGNGQLGNNDAIITKSLNPVSVMTKLPLAATASALDHVIAIAVGLNHSLALKDDGSVLSWGQNTAGQLGINSVTPARLATTIPTFDGMSIIAIAAGANHSLALRSDGVVFAWGANESGQLGDGKSVNLKVPTPIATLSNIVGLAGGVKHSLALRNDGTVWAWGANSSGQLGDLTTIARLTPVQVSGLTDIIAIAANGEHSLALHGDKTVWAWGNNAVGQLGDGTITNRSTPQMVTGLSNAVAIAAGNVHSVAIVSGGSTKTWGGNWQGQLGDSSQVDKYIQTPIAFVIPAPPPPPPQVAGISAGVSHTLVVAASGKVFGWGSNEFGQVGDNATVRRLQPVATYFDASTAPKTAIQVAAGDTHSLALLQDKTVVAWGANGLGQLGDTTTMLSLLPVSTVSTSGALTSVTAVAAGLNHSLALKDDGSVFAWGQNSAGQLGLNSVVNAKQATVITTLAGLSISAIAAGPNHSLALRHDGAVYAWGVNESGQLGDGKTASLKIPTPIAVLSNIIAIAAGTKHSLALRSDGTVWAWGGNSSGQLGDASTTARLVPVQVSGLTGISAIAAHGEHSLAMRRDGSVWAWGNNGLGQLGDGTTSNRSTPKLVGTWGTAVAIFAGLTHSTVVLSDASALTWGGNWQGQLGNNTQNGQLNPVAIPAGVGAGAVVSTPPPGVAAGVSHTLVVDKNGKVFGWGSNEFGQVGDGTTYRRLMPVTVSAAAFDALTDATTAIQVAAGDVHSLALRKDGKVLSWGFNGSGQLGDLTTSTATRRLTPLTTGTVVNTTDVELTGVTAIAAGMNHSLALKSDGSVLAWGQNSSGQLGINSVINAKQASVITTLAGLSISAIAAGPNHSLALRHDGAVYAWGVNESGQLGDGKTANLKIPTQIAALSNIVALAAGAKHSLALRSDGTVWAWGANSSGQLGDASTTARLVPVQVNGLTGITAISANGEHNLALRSDGTVWAWGNNGLGQLGDSTNTHRSTPQLVGTWPGTNIPVLGTAIAAGAAHSVAIWSDASIATQAWAAQSWGGNWQGQLGDGKRTSKSKPETVNLLDATPAAPLALPDISAGDSHTLALNVLGKVYGWGSNEFGQVGDGTVAQRLAPVAVTGIGVASRVAAGDVHSLALVGGTVWAWGFNGAGQLGNNSTTSSLTPVQPVDATGPMSGMTAIAAGLRHSMALKNDGSVWAWGENSAGQLGINSFTAASKATAITSLAGLSITAIAAAPKHSLALRHDGAVYAWGINESGQLGDGKTVSLKTPAQIAALSNIVAVAGGTKHSLALRNDGTVWAWGANSSGQLGDATTTARLLPVQVFGLTEIISIAANGEHSLALSRDGTVWAWGNNAVGQLGDGTKINRSTPRLVAKLLSAGAISAGSSHSVAIQSINLGQAIAWGGNWYGQQGNGTTTDSLVPGNVSGLGGAGNLTLGVFNPIFNAARAAVVISNALTLSGFVGTLPISVSGGAYSVDGQPYSNVPSIVSSGSKVTLSQVSASQPGRKTTATLVVGASSSSFDVITQPVDMSWLMLLLD